MASSLVQTNDGGHEQKEHTFLQSEKEEEKEDVLAFHPLARSIRQRFVRISSMQTPCIQLVSPSSSSNVLHTSSASTDWTDKTSVLQTVVFLLHILQTNIEYGIELEAEHVRFVTREEEEEEKNLVHSKLPSMALWTDGYFWLRSSSRFETWQTSCPSVPLLFKDVVEQLCRLNPCVYEHVVSVLSLIATLQPPDSSLVQTIRAHLLPALYGRKERSYLLKLEHLFQSQVELFENIRMHLSQRKWSLLQSELKQWSLLWVEWKTRPLLRTFREPEKMEVFFLLKELAQWVTSPSVSSSDEELPVKQELSRFLETELQWDVFANEYRQFSNSLMKDSHSTFQELVTRETHAQQLRLERVQSYHSRLLCFLRQSEISEAWEDMRQQISLAFVSSLDTNTLPYVSRAHVTSFWTRICLYSYGTDLRPWLHTFNLSKHANRVYWCRTFVACLLIVVLATVSPSTNTSLEDVWDALKKIEQQMLEALAPVYYRQQEQEFVPMQTNILPCWPTRFLPCSEMHPVSSHCQESEPTSFDEHRLVEDAQYILQMCLGSGLSFWEPWLLCNSSSEQEITFPFFLLSNSYPDCLLLFQHMWDLESSFQEKNPASLPDRLEVYKEEWEHWFPES